MEIYLAEHLSHENKIKQMQLEFTNWTDEAKFLSFQAPK